MKKRLFLNLFKDRSNYTQSTSKKFSLQLRMTNYKKAFPHISVQINACELMDYLSLVELEFTTVNPTYLTP